MPVVDLHIMSNFAGSFSADLFSVVVLCPTAKGILSRIGASAGAKLANMNHAWWWQVVLEHAIQSRETSSVVHVPAGDSMILVNCDGRRVANEKTLYNERTPGAFYLGPGPGPLSQSHSFRYLR